MPRTVQEIEKALKEFHRVSQENPSMLSDTITVVDYLITLRIELAEAKRDNTTSVALPETVTAESLLADARREGFEACKAKALQRLWDAGHGLSAYFIIKELEP